MEYITVNKELLNKEIGQRVRKMREYHEMTRENLAEYADISVQFLATIESGKKSMTTYTLYKIAKALQVSADYLLSGETVSGSSDNINLLLETLSPSEKDIAEHLLQTYIRGLSAREQLLEKKMQV